MKILVEKVNDKLNSKLFDNERLREPVRNKLIEISKSFIEELKENEIPIKVLDAVLVGSNVSYNYHNKSDLDLHIIVDLNISKEPNILDLLYNYYKSNYNDKYDITIKGIEVEVYLENKDSKSMSNGVYSIYKDKWIKIPSKEDIPEIDISKRFKHWDKEYQKVLKGSLEEIEAFLNKLYIMRKLSLVNNEYALDNLIFKEFRNLGYIEELKELKDKLKSKKLSLENKKMSIKLLLKESKNGRYTIMYTDNPREEDMEGPSSNNLKSLISKLGIYKDTYLDAYIYDNIENEIVNLDDIPIEESLLKEKQLTSNIPSLRRSDGSYKIESGRNKKLISILNYAAKLGFSAEVYEGYHDGLGLYLSEPDEEDIIIHLEDGDGRISMQVYDEYYTFVSPDREDIDSTVTDIKALLKDWKDNYDDEDEDDDILEESQANNSEWFNKIKKWLIDNSTKPMPSNTLIELTQFIVDSYKNEGIESWADFKKEHNNIKDDIYDFMDAADDPYHTTFNEYINGFDGLEENWLMETDKEYGWGIIEFGYGKEPTRWRFYEDESEASSVYDNYSQRVQAGKLKALIMLDSKGQPYTTTGDIDLIQYWLDEKLEAFLEKECENMEPMAGGGGGFFAEGKRRLSKPALQEKYLKEYFDKEDIIKTIRDVRMFYKTYIEKNDLKGLCKELDEQFEDIEEAKDYIDDQWLLKMDVESNYWKDIKSGKITGSQYWKEVYGNATRT